MLRDTGAAQSIVLDTMLDLSSETYTNTDVLLCGVGSDCIKAPLHLKSDLVTGYVTVAVCAKLPVEGVEFILGNDLAVGKVFPSPVVWIHLMCVLTKSLRHF